jgi:hypothetical protein
MHGPLSQHVHWVKGIDPIADFNDGTKYSDVVNCKNYRYVTFLYHKGVGTTGTSTITVLAGDDAADPPTTSTAIPFRYKAITSGDTEGALTDATTSGFTTTAGSSQIYIIEVDTEELGDTGYKYLCLKMVEVVNSPVVGAVGIIMHGGRYQQDIPATAIT